MVSKITFPKKGIYVSQRHEWDPFLCVFLILFEIFMQPNAETEDNITPVLSAVAAGSLACIESLVQVPSFFL